MAVNRNLPWFFIILSCSYLNIILCDPECDKFYVIGNQSYNKCELNQHLNQPNSEFKGGDFYELFDFDTYMKQSYTLISIKHQETDGQDDKKYTACFFCISFYNVSSGKFEIQDKLILDYHKETESLNKIWEGKREKNDPNKPDLIFYDIGAKSELLEGHYKFTFRNDTALYQLQIDKPIRKDSEKILDDSRSKAVTLEIYGNSTNISSSPIWIVFPEEMDPKFRICFDFYKNSSYRDFYEDNVKKIEVKCKVFDKPEKFSYLKDCVYDSSTNEITLPEVSPSIKNDIAFDNIKVDLTCRIHYRGKQYNCISCEFTYNQPIVLRMKPKIHAAGSTIISVAIVGLLLTLTAAVICYRKKKTEIGMESVASFSKQSPTMFWEENPAYSSDNSLDEFDGGSLYPNWLQDRIDMIYDPKCIKKEKKLGQGHFGTVFEGKIKLGNAVYPVAIKSPKYNTEREIEEFLEEVKSMLEINAYHENIVNLQGITCQVSAIEDDVVNCSLILEYCAKGNLRSYLISQKPTFLRSLEYYENNKKLETFLLPSDGKPVHDIRLLYRWIFQVANGMDFLAQKHIHHGDLATRNILLTDSLVAKISDFGLSRRLYEDLSEPQPVLKPRPEHDQPVALPVKWLAPEVLQHHSIIPEKSDVWSYGVMAWEVFQLGADPYRNRISLMELISELEQGIRLPKPYCCPTPIAEIISQCFMANPTDRPSFEETRSKIQIAFAKLEEIQSSSPQAGASSENGLNYADLQFNEMYVDMRRRNRKLQDPNAASANDTRHDKLESVFMNATYEFEQHVASDELSSKTDNWEQHSPELTITSNRYKNDIVTEMIAPKYEQLSLRFKNQKRPVSFGGRDPNLFHQTDVTSPMLLPAQSYPCFQNPSYMMMADV